MRRLSFVKWISAQCEHTPTMSFLSMPGADSSPREVTKRDGLATGANLCQLNITCYRRALFIDLIKGHEANKPFLRQVKIDSNRKPSSRDQYSSALQV